MAPIVLNSIWNLSLDGRNLTIDKPGKTKKDIQIITTISSTIPRYPASLRITTPAVAKAMHIQTFMTVSPPATIASGPFSFEFFPHETGDGFNLLVNKEFYYFTQPQVEFIPFDHPVTLLIPAIREPLIEERKNIQVMLEFCSIKQVVISGEHSDKWQKIFPPKTPVEIQTQHNQILLPF